MKSLDRSVIAAVYSDACFFGSIVGSVCADKWLRARSNRKLFELLLELTTQAGDVEQRCSYSQLCILLSCVTTSMITSFFL